MALNEFLKLKTFLVVLNRTFRSPQIFRDPNAGGDGRNPRSRQPISLHPISFVGH